MTCCPSGIFTSARSEISICTVCLWPFSAARCNAVRVWVDMRVNINTAVTLRYTYTYIYIYIYTCMYIYAYIYIHIYIHIYISIYIYMYISIYSYTYTFISHSRELWFDIYILIYIHICNIHANSGVISAPHFWWWVLQHCTGFARLIWGRLRVHRAFIYSDWFVCSVCFCPLFPRLTLLLSVFGHSALPPPRGGGACRVSPQSCQSHESLWGSWYSRLLCSE